MFSELVLLELLTVTGGAVAFCVTARMAHALGADGTRWFSWSRPGSLHD